MKCKICEEEKDRGQMRTENICNICSYNQTSKKEAETDKKKFKKARNDIEVLK